MNIPRPPFTVTADIIRRFDRFVSKSDDGCWEWTGSRGPKGYGHFTINEADKPRTYKAHRVAYKLATGVHPGAMLVCHSCDNPSCVRPAHLFLGTGKDNAADRDRKGRGGKLFGTANPEAKLNPAAVREIRLSTLSPGKEAARHGVTRRAILAVREGRTWSHVR
jgi:hypothetical protein